MNERFEKVIKSLETSFARLLSMSPSTSATLPRSMPSSGIYLLSEGNSHLYVGRSRHIKARLGRHCLPGSTHKKAAFAFRLAREATGNLKPTYRKVGSRAALMQDQVFREAFAAAKARIRTMDVRFVEEPDPVMQCVLEVYVAVALNTPYNDFDTH